MMAENKVTHVEICWNGYTAMKELCYCPPSYGGSGLMDMVAMVPESFLLFIGPMSCGRFSAMNSFGGGGRYGYLYVTDADMSLGKVDSETLKAADTVIDKFRPKVLILLFTCDVVIAGIDEEALLKELRQAHPGTVFQSFLVNHIASGSGHGPVEMMYVRAMDMLDGSGEGDEVYFVGSGMAPDCNSDINTVLNDLGVKGDHPLKAKTFEEFRRMGDARYVIVTSADGLIAAERSGRRFCAMYPTFSFDEIKKQYGELFKMVGKECDITRFEDSARSLLSQASGLVRGRTLSIGSSITRRTFGLVRTMVENGFEVTDVFINDESYEGTAAFDEEDRSWVTSEHPEISVHRVGDTGMISEIGKCCRTDIAIGFNAAYFSDSKMVINVSDNGQIGYEPLMLVMRRICDAVGNPKDMRGLMASYGVSI